MNRPIIIGLTGPSGAGKTSFCEASNAEFEHIDCDLVARQVMDSDTKARLAAEFGPEILTENGVLNRKALADIAFADKNNTKRLEQITHPPIKKELMRRIQALKQEGKDILLDAPLLFESGLDSLCDYTVAVLSDTGLRRKRIMSRDRLTRQQAELRLRLQKEDSYYRDRADFILENSGDLHGFSERVQELLESIRRNA